MGTRALARTIDGDPSASAEAKDGARADADVAGRDRIATKAERLLDLYWGRTNTATGPR